MSFYDATASAPTLTRAEVSKLLVQTGKTKGAEREHMIYSLALGTALREHEIVALNIGDVATELEIKSRIQLMVYKGAARQFKGAGGKLRRSRIRQVVFLPKMVRAKLAYYLKWKKKAGESLRASSPLFCVSKVGFGAMLGDRLSTRSVRFHFRRWQKVCGFERLHGFHVLRHTSISNLYRATKDLRHAQSFARHASVNTTEIYTHLTEEEVFEAIEGIQC